MHDIDTIMTMAPVIPVLTIERLDDAKPIADPEDMFSKLFEPLLLIETNSFVIMFPNPKPNSCGVVFPCNPEAMFDKEFT